jgi:ABC-type sugar transport system ATPase subunit
VVGVSKSFGGPDPALDDLSLEILDKELLVLLGPSGCGKTTLLNLLAGLEQPTQGDVYFGGQRVTDIPAEERDISMVFQSIGLYPHMNAIDNITFPLRLRKVPAAVIRERVEDMAGLLGIGRLLRRRINELSGGERQRVAIAKALIKRPRLFLLDEAFSNLDADLRRQLRSELVRIHHELDITMVFVTHDQEEAMSIADRIAVLNAGRLVQVGAPLEIYRHPATAWAARFIGAYPINLFNAELIPGAELGVQVEGQPPVVLDAVTRQRWQAANLPPKVILAIRPEHLHLSTDGPCEMQATVHIREVLGDTILYHLRAGQHQLRAVRPAAEVYELDQPIGLSFDWSRVFVFDAGTERALVA